MPATAMLPCCLVLVLAALAHPVVADYAVNSMPCPSAIGDIVTVRDGSDLSVVFAMNGTGKTYLLEPGSYSLPSQIKPASTSPSTTCFIGGGARGDVVITATSDIAAYAPAFYMRSTSSEGGTPISLGLKHLILDNGENAGGVFAEGELSTWSVEDVTIRHGTGGLYSNGRIVPELANVTVEYVQGEAVVALTGPLNWSDLSVTDCTVGGYFALEVGTTGTISGRLYVARNRGLSCTALLVVDTDVVVFTGDVIVEGNEVDGTECDGGAAFFDYANIRFTESSTLLVRDNVMHGRASGGVALRGSTVSVLGSARIVNNTADRVGGGLTVTPRSSITFNSVCITQNTAAGGGSGIYMSGAGTVTFNSPSSAQIGGNSPVDSTIFVAADDASWTCSGSGAPRGQGNYSVNGPVCACTAPAVPGGASTCACPTATPAFDPESCTCVECLPGSGPCCSATAAEFVPCTRSVTFVPDTIASPFCEDVELLVVVTDTAPAGSSPLGQPAETAPAVDVPVVFGVSGDCEPSVQARTVRTDAQGRARVRVTAQGPGVAAVTAAVTSGGSLPRKAVLATSHIKFLPCGHGREHAYDDDDEHDGYARRPGYQHTRTARPYAADDDNDVTAVAFEAVATQMALQALKEEGQQAGGQAAAVNRGAV